MTTEIIRELTVLKDVSEVTSESILLQANRSETQWSQKAMLKSLKEIRV